jgi:hypothetical protein
MPGINEVFADNPQYNIFGLITGSVTEIPFPSGSCKLVRFKADPDNLGTFFIGTWGANNCVWPLAPGDDTGWVAPPSADGNTRGLGSYSVITPSGTSERIYYWMQR